MGVNSGGFHEKMTMLKRTISITAVDANTEFGENFAPEYRSARGISPAANVFAEIHSSSFSPLPRRRTTPTVERLVKLTPHAMPRIVPPKRQANPAGVMRQPGGTFVASSGDRPKNLLRQ